MDFIELVKLASKMLGNQYILVATDYATKWVEAQTLHTNTNAITTKFLYEHIITIFGCPLTIVTNQGTHFINDAIKYVTNHFILKHIVLLFIIHKEMDRLNLQTRFLELYQPK